MRITPVRISLLFLELDYIHLRAQRTTSTQVKYFLKGWLLSIQVIRIKNVRVKDPTFQGASHRSHTDLLISDLSTATLAT